MESDRNLSVYSLDRANTDSDRRRNLAHAGPPLLRQRGAYGGTAEGSKPRFPRGSRFRANSSRRRWLGTANDRYSLLLLCYFSTES